MNKRDLLKEPFTKEELKQTRLTQEEVESLQDGLYDVYADEPHWLEEGETIDYATPFLKKYKDTMKFKVAYPNFDKLSSWEQWEITDDERWNTTFTSQDKMDEFHKNIWDKALDDRIDMHMEDIQCEDGFYYRGCADSLGVESTCCKSMYRTSTTQKTDDVKYMYQLTVLKTITDGICKPACQCSDCEIFYAHDGPESPESDFIAPHRTIDEQEDFKFIISRLPYDYFPEYDELITQKKFKTKLWGYDSNYAKSNLWATGKQERAQYKDYMIANWEKEEIIVKGERQKLDHEISECEIFNNNFDFNLRCTGKHNEKWDTNWKLLNMEKKQ